MPENTDIIYLSDILLPRDPRSALHAVTKQYVDTGLSGKASSTHTHNSTDITGLGTAASVDTGTQQGNVPLLITNGKLPDSVLPALAITEIFTAEDEEEMLALSAQKGDLCVRTDLSKTFILTLEDPSQLNNWKELLAPTGAVTSVNGQTGAVVIDTLPDGGNTGDILVRQSSGSAWQSSRYIGTVTGDGSKKTFTLSHNLNQKAVQVDVLQENLDSSLTQVMVNVTRTSANAIALNFAAAPANGTVFKVICRA